jgi:UDP-2,3-diacylglucosamine hydrolase
MERPVYFISDAHLGSSADPRDDEPRLRRLVPFLRHVAEVGAEHLYIVGDLFDLWFEYDHVMPWRHAEILSEIRDVVRRGVPVTFLGGNHDWWSGRVFREWVGMTVHTDPLRVTHHGVHLFIAHGDGLASRTDSGYLLLKRVLRNPWVIRALRLVHPDLAYAIGFRISRFSRKHLTTRTFHLAPALRSYIEARLAEGHEAFLLGHLHARHRETLAAGEVFVLGDWMTIFSALRLERGRFHWEDWSSGRRVDVEDASSTVTGGHGDGVDVDSPR